MKDLAPPETENGSVEEVLLETIVSAHYLALQMRMLASAPSFRGAVETELMAEALSRWAHRAGVSWIEGAAGKAPESDGAEQGERPRSVGR